MLSIYTNVWGYSWIMNKTDNRDVFTRFSNHASRIFGKPIGFMLTLLVVVIWLITGPIFQFSTTWQFMINSAVTILTFLMVFLIQNTQNRDTLTIQIKLDELIRSIEPASNALLNLDKLSQEELEKIRDRYSDVAEKARGALEKRKTMN